MADLRGIVVPQSAHVTARRTLPHGLFVGSHAVAEGLLTRKQLMSGLYRRVLHNVYADPSLPDDHRLRARAAALVMPPEAAIGGRSAAAWFGAPFSGLGDPVLVVAPRGCSWDGPRGVRVHKTDLRPAETWTDDDGVRLTTVRRTAWEVATIEPTLTAVALVDGMLRDGELTEYALMSEVLARRGQWRSSRARDLLPLVDARAESPPESRIRAACVLAGLPAPVPQFVVQESGAFLGRVDLAWPEARLIVEYEGAHHFEELQIRRDDQRYAKLVAAGWRVIRLSSSDLRDLDGVVARILRALEESIAAG
jgi:hypothetical protein